MKVTEIDKRLESIKALLFELIEDVDETGLEGSNQEIAEAASAFHAFVDQVKGSYGLFTTEVINRIEYTPVPLEVGGATVEIKGGSTRKKWDHKAAAEEVAKRITESSYDLDTGERLKDPEEMIVELLEYAGVGYWKVKPMASLGLNVDMYCESTEGPKSLIVRRNK